MKMTMMKMKMMKKKMMIIKKMIFSENIFFSFFPFFVIKKYFLIGALKIQMLALEQL